VDDPAVYGLGRNPQQRTDQHLVRGNGGSEWR
jgi:hypothetical protein